MLTIIRILTLYLSQAHAQDFVQTEAAILAENRRVLVVQSHTLYHNLSQDPVDPLSIVELAIREQKAGNSRNRQDP